MFKLQNRRDDMGKLVDEIIENMNKPILLDKILDFFSKIFLSISKMFKFIVNYYNEFRFRILFPRFVRVGPTTLTNIFDFFNLTKAQIRELKESSSICCDLPVFYGAKFETVVKSVFNSVDKTWGPVFGLCDDIQSYPPRLFGITSSIEEDPKGFRYKGIVIWASKNKEFNKTLKRMHTFDVLGINLKI